MEKITLQQGETTSIAIVLDEPLAEDEVLYFAISDKTKILISGDEIDGGITRVDDTHFTAHLTHEDTYDLRSCFFELAYAKPNKELVNIGVEPIKLEFTQNKIKSILR